MPQSFWRDRLHAAHERRQQRMDVDSGVDGATAATASSSASVDDAGARSRAPGGAGPAGGPVLPRPVIAIWDFVSETEGDLPFGEGQRFDVVSEEPGQGWWTGVLDGILGIFPRDYVEDATTRGAARSDVGILGEASVDERRPKEGTPDDGMVEFAAGAM